MKEEIKQNILRTLRDAAGHPLPQSVLILQVRSRTRPFPKDADTLDCIASLEGLAFILKQDNELDESDPAWILDEKGQAFILRKRL